MKRLSLQIEQGPVCFWGNMNTSNDFLCIGCNLITSWLVLNPKRILKVQHKGCL